MYKLQKQLLLILFVFLCCSVFSFAGIPEFFDQPDTGYTSNVVTDMAVHNGSIWFATDEGLNYSLDGGLTWLLYDNSNGLVSSSISALASIGGRIWTATNHEEKILDYNTAISDGVSYSDDGGLNWTQVNFEAAPNNIPYVWGGDRTIFDITGHYDINNELLDDWVFFTAFAGGLLASRDGGDTWKRIFPSSLDSAQFYVPDAQPSLRNRYFSCVVDTSHGDTLSVWAGTAGGMFQYIYAEPKDKAFAKNVTDIEFCDSCGTDDLSYVYFGGLEAFTRSNKINESASSKFVSDGLTGNHITAILDFGGKLFVGSAMSAEDYTSTGLAVSTDKGETFNPFNGIYDTAFIGNGRKISDFAFLSDRIYMAVEESGLFYSLDTGVTWDTLRIEDYNPLNRRNVVRALEAIGDTLNLATDSGLVRLFLSPTGVVDSSRYFVFPENSLSSTRLLKVATQNLSTSNQRIWTVNVPLDTILNLSTPIIAYSDDGGISFTEQIDLNAFNSDIGFLGDTVIILGTYGAIYSDNGMVTSQPFLIEEKEISAVDTLSNDTTFKINASMTNEALNTLKISGDTVIIGGQKGYAVSVDRGNNFKIKRVNIENLAADAVLNYTSSILGIDGDWIPAMEVQYKTDDPFARIWASVRPTYGGLPGISIGVAAPVVDTLGDTVRYDRLWGRVHDEFAWNFAFASDTVFAATNSGLIYAHSDSLTDPIASAGYDWTTVEMVDASGVPLLLEGTPVYAVEVDDNYIWVGTDDRTVRLNRDSLNNSKAFYVEDPTNEVYAFPVPFSHVNSNALDFHFVVDEPTEITIEIYDFAMHLVRRVVDNVTFAPGVYPTAGTNRFVWDGLNGKGDEVAIGIYYFKISYANGEVYWDKIAVIP